MNQKELVKLHLDVAEMADRLEGFVSEYQSSEQAITPNNRIIVSTIMDYKLGCLNRSKTYRETMTNLPLDTHTIRYMELLVMMRQEQHAIDFLDRVLTLLDNHGIRI